MSDKIEIKWQAADGYVGGNRPQVTYVDPTDFVHMDKHQVENTFDEIMEDSFRQRVCWEVDDYEGAIASIMEAAANLENKEKRS